MLLSGSIGPKISEIEFGQNILLYTFSWPKRLWPKCPGRNVLIKTSVAKTSYLFHRAQLIFLEVGTVWSMIKQNNQQIVDLVIWKFSKINHRLLILRYWIVTNLTLSQYQILDASKLRACRRLF